MSSTEKAEQASTVDPDQGAAQRIPEQSRGEQAITKSAFTRKVEEDRRVAAEKRAAAEAQASQLRTPWPQVTLSNDAVVTEAPDDSARKVHVAQASTVEPKAGEAAPAPSSGASADAVPTGESAGTASAAPPADGRPTDGHQDVQAVEVNQVAAEKPAEASANTSASTPSSNTSAEKPDEPDRPRQAEKKNEAAAAKNEKAAARESAKAERAEKRADRQRAAKAASDAVRERVAQAIRVVTLLIALVLAVAALLVALRHSVNEQNVAVQAFTDTARFFDGPLNLQNGVFSFTGKHALIKEALLNWGLAAVVYLVVGRVLARLIRP